MTTEFLNVEQPIIEVSGNPGFATPYFEDFLFRLVKITGGEGDDLIQDAFDLATYPPDLPAIVGQLQKAKKDIEELKACQPSIDLLSQIKSLRRDIDDLKANEQQPVDTKGILKRLENIEVQIS